MESIAQNKWSFWVIAFALIAGLILSILSWLEVCVEHCSANQDYRLFGLPFAFIGIAFFTTLMLLHFFSLRYDSLSKIVAWMIALALGSELMFIAVQKYQIGHWCPVCLSIAASVGIASIVLATQFFKSLKTNSSGEIMQKLKQGFTWVSFSLLGFLMAFVGVSKPDTAAAAINDIKEKIAFGQKNSPVEVYIVSDWYCPSCRKVEPEIEKIFPQLISKAAVYFIDYPIHKKSQNFTPYNLSFLIYDKPQYFKARNMLTKIADKTETPTDEDIEKEAKKNHLIFKELSFLEVKTGIEFFDKIVKQYDLNATPTIIVVNPHRKSVAKFVGRDEIDPKKILETVQKFTPAQ